VSELLLLSRLTHPLPLSPLTEETFSPEFYNEALQAVPSLFFQAKHEVFMLLKDDNYARWNKMESFEQFIAAMKPYLF
jgi:hypothetical protein